MDRVFGKNLGLGVWGPIWADCTHYFWFGIILLNPMASFKNPYQSKKTKHMVFNFIMGRKITSISAFLLEGNSTQS